MKSTDGGNNDEPEPQKYINFLVNNVKRQDTETIKFLDGTRGTKFVECAFGDLGEDHIQWVTSAHDVFLRHANNV